MKVGLPRPSDPETVAPKVRVELRAELPRVPAEVLHCGRGIENHILCHAVSHCHIRVRNERLGHRKRCSPQRRRDWDDTARLVQPVENSSNHLAIGYRVFAWNCVDLVGCGETGCCGKSTDRQISCMDRLAQT